MFIKFFLFLYICVLASKITFARIDTSKVNVDFNFPTLGQITPLHYGVFFEFVDNAMLGTTGLLAQEILDRGFDSPPCRQGGVSCNWFHYFTNTAGKWSLVPGGVNKNGDYFQRIENVYGDGEVGVFQFIYLPEEASTFYIYLKGEPTVGYLNLSFKDTLLSKTFFSYDLAIPYENWKKIEIDIPANLNAKRCLLVLSIKNKGIVDIDESSLISKKHKYQMRNEVYELFKEWGPPISRYPGGCFADEHAAHWEYGIGDLDQRKSANPYDAKTQRLDFGTDEFIAFCKSINSEPHLVVNFANGTPEEAANWVEYCNGDTNTKFGKLRANNGHPEHYNVKYWEIGNEQWSNSGNYARGLIEFVKEMKKRDSSIIIICDGNIWGHKPFFDTLIDIAGEFIDIYGWHYVHNVWEKNINPEYVYLSMVAGPKDAEKSIKEIDEWVKTRKPFLNIKQGATELWTAFNDFNWMKHDRLKALETGLWAALQLFIGFRFCDTYVINEVTCNSGVFLHAYDRNGLRKFVPTPTFYVMSVLRKHTGINSHYAKIECNTFDVPDIKGLWVDYDIPWVDAAVTSTRDSIFIAIVNRSITDSNLIKLNLNNIELDTLASIVEISSQHFLDMNTPQEPGRIKPIYKTSGFNSFYIVPPLSLTILSIPMKDTNDNKKPSDVLFKAYPNPFLDKINFKMILDDEGTYELNFYNILGELVYSIPIKNDTRSLVLNTAFLTRGFYLAVIKSATKIKTIKLWKD